jgi:hypothetical protein
MTEQLTGYEASSVAEIEAILDGSPADADQVYLDTIGYSERALAAVAAKRAGSGSLPDPITTPVTIQTAAPESDALAISADGLSTGQISNSFDDLGGGSVDVSLNIRSEGAGVAYVRLRNSGSEIVRLGTDTFSFDSDANASLVELMRFSSLIWGTLLQVFSDQVAVSGPLFFYYIPSADPHAAGQVWQDPASGNVLKVSQG